MNYKRYLHFVNNPILLNTGDNEGSVMEYIPEFWTRGLCLRHSFRNISYGRLRAQDVVILGGSGLFDLSDDLNEKIMELTDTCQEKGIPIVVFGAGVHSTGKNITKKIDFSKFDLAGIRDYDYKEGVNVVEYVPCATCMSDLFDVKYTIEREIGIVHHFRRTIENIEELSEKFDSIRMLGRMSQIVKFLGGCETIITNSYHAALWGQLLGRKVILTDPNWASKFKTMRHVPTTYSGNIATDIKNTKIHEGFLEESREIVTTFRNKVLALIDNPNQAIRYRKVQSIINKQNNEKREALERELIQSQWQLTGKFYTMLDGDINSKTKFHQSIPKATGLLRLKQMSLVWVLSIFDKVCKRLDIPYSLCGGTLLGAVRNGGFIPWDDDIDVIMMEDGLKKLLRFSDGEQFDDLPKIETKLGRRDKHLGFPFFLVPKIPYILDIFLFTYADEGSAEHRNQLRTLRRRTKSDTIPQLGIERFADKSKFYPIFDDYLEQVKLLVNEKGTTDYLIGTLLSGHGPYAYPTDKCLPLAEIDFEGLKLPVPKDPDAILTMRYGDYWHLSDDIGKTHGKLRMEGIKQCIEFIKEHDEAFYRQHLEDEWEKLVTQS